MPVHVYKCIQPTTSLCNFFFLSSGPSLCHSITSSLKISSLYHRNQKYQTFFSHALSHYQTPYLLFHCVYLLYVFFFYLLHCLYFFRRMATTANKRTVYMYM